MLYSFSLLVKRIYDVGVAGGVAAVDVATVVGIDNVGVAGGVAAVDVTTVVGIDDVGVAGGGATINVAVVVGIDDVGVAGEDTFIYVMGNNSANCYCQHHRQDNKSLHFRL